MIMAHVNGQLVENTSTTSHINKVTNTENKDDWQQTSQFKQSLISLAGTMSHDQHKNITFLAHIKLILVSVKKIKLRKGCYGNFMQ